MAISLSKDAPRVIRQLINKFNDNSKRAASWRCFFCGGRVDITAHFDANNNVCGSTGECRTSTCPIRWEETHDVQHQQA